MSRIYATNDRGERFLHYIECDRCTAYAKPGSKELLKGGWVKGGWYKGPGTEKVEYDYCPRHAAEAKSAEAR